MKLYKVQCVVEIPIGSDTAREAERLLYEMLFDKHQMKQELALSDVQLDSALIDNLEVLPESWQGCKLFNTENLDNITPEELIHNGAELAKQKALKLSGEDIVNDAIDKLEGLGLSSETVMKLLKEYTEPKY